MKKLRIAPILLSVFVTAAMPVAAQDADVPYWASIDASKVNMRVGPSPTYPIDWVYEREGLPVKVIRVNQGWRYVEDPDGARGWMVGRMLSRQRSAIIVGDDLAPLRAEPDEAGELRWTAEPGVVGFLGDCEAGWCEFDIAGRAGWVEQNRIWGAGEP